MKRTEASDLSHKNDKLSLMLELSVRFNLPGLLSRFLSIGSAALFAASLIACSDQPPTDEYDPATDPTRYVAVESTSAYEGQALVFHVILSGPAPTTILFNYGTKNGTAIGGTHYTAISGTQSILLGSASSSFTISTFDNGLDAADRTFSFTIAVPSSLKVSSLSATGTIRDDEPTPNLYINDTSIAEGGTAHFVVTMTNPSENAVSFNYTTSSSSALSGSDFTSISGRASLPSGQLALTLAVLTVDDAFYELTESYSLNLSSSTGANLTDNVGLGTLTSSDPMPSLAIYNTQTTEGSAVSFLISLSAPSGVVTRYTYTLSPGSALSGSDYSGAGGSGSIPVSTGSSFINVTSVNDVLYELDETFGISITSVTYASLTGASAVGTILNNDALPQLRVNDSNSVIEGGSLVFTVSIGSASGLPVSFNFSSADGSATSPNDFSALSGSTTIPAGSLARTFTIATADDGGQESTEVMSFNISSPGQASIADGSGSGTILDNDTPPSLYIVDGSGSEGNTLTFTVSMSQVYSGSVAFDVSTSSGTATSGTDFTSLSSTLTITAGQLSRTFNLVSIEDSLDEIDESFNITLTNLINAVAGDVAGSGVILDDDPSPAIWIADAGSIVEGSLAIFNVSLSASSARSVSFNYASVSGTASAGSDFTSSTGVLSFPLGGQLLSITISTIDDVSTEPTETFTLVLSSLVNAATGDLSGSASITDNDSSGPSLYILDASTTEGSPLLFTITMSGSSASPVSFNLSTFNGSAIAGKDYVTYSGTRTILPGQISIAITLSSSVDSLNEDSEQFTLSISSLVNAVSGDSSALGTILDDDPQPSLFITDSAVTEGNSAFVVISLDSPSGKSVNFEYATSDSSASSGSDYDFSTATIFIPVESSRVTIIIGTVEDGIGESLESFNVNLSNLQNVSSGDINGLVSITDDDPTSTSLFVLNPSSVTEGNSINIPVTIATVLGVEVSFSYDTISGTASSGTDYSNTSAVATIPAGSQSINLVLSSLDDGTTESTEVFYVTLSGLVNATAGNSLLANITLMDNDSPPVLSILDATQVEGGTFTFTISLSHPSSFQTSFEFVSSGISAVDGSDYATAFGAITLNPGVTLWSIEVVSQQDAIYEGTQSFNLILSNLNNLDVGDIVGVGNILDDETPPNLDIFDASTTEGGTLSFIISLSATSEVDAVFSYTSVDQSAGGGLDFDVASGNLSILAGSQTAVLLVPSIQDSLFEGNETFAISLFNLIDASSGDTTATGTILNDDSAPALAIFDQSASEGSNLVFTLSLSAVSGLPVLFNANSLDGTATSAGSDYTLLSISGSIPAGASTGTVTLLTTNDSIYELDETLLVTLSGLSNASSGDLSSIGTILNNDAAPNIFVLDSSAAEGGGIAFQVSLSAISALNATFTIASFDGTASLADSDYTSLLTSGLIPSGNLSASFTLMSTNDAKFENNEIVGISLSGLSHAGVGDLSASLTILNNDAAPGLLVQNVSSAEGTTFNFTVSLTALSGLNTSFSYATADVQAVASVDYSNSSGTLTILAGQLLLNLAIPSIQDSLDEFDEDFRVSLNSATNANILDGDAYGTIQDEDLPPAISVVAGTLTEAGSSQIIITLSAISGKVITVDYLSTNGSASTTSDYFALSGSLTLIAGVGFTSVLAQANWDDLNENTEAFTLSLANAANATIVNFANNVTVLDDDTCSRFTIDSFTLAGASPSTAYDYIQAGGNTILLAGVAKSGTPTYYHIRRSTDNGSTWSNVLSVQSNNLASGAKAITRTSNGSIVTNGYFRRTGGGGGARMYIRRSTDAGANWLTPTGSEWQHTGGRDAIGNDLAADTAGRVYAVGRGNDAADDHWITRVSTDHGATWGTGAANDDYQLSANANAEANGVAVDSSGNVYVAGYATDASARTHMIVRKSTNFGSTWATVMDYQYNVTFNSSASAIAIDSSNNIYVAGFGNDGVANRWIVRKSTDGGSNWTTVDDYQLVAGSAAQANGVSTNTSGHIVVVGASTQSGVTRWIARRSTDGGSTWETVENYLATVGFNSAGQKVRLHSNGDYVVPGDGGASYGSHWRVRRMTCY